MACIAQHNTAQRSGAADRTPTLILTVASPPTQVTALIRTHGIPAAVLNSTTTETLARQIYRDVYGLRRGKEPYIKLLYVTPERLLKSTSFQDLLTFLYDHVSDVKGRSWGEKEKRACVVGRVTQSRASTLRWIV